MQQVNASQIWQDLGPGYFRELSTFGAIQDAVLLNMLTAGRVLQLKSGEVLYSVGDRTAYFYIVLQGSINNFIPGQDGSMVISRHHEPGDDLGFVHMISLSNRTATAIVEQDAVILEISIEQFFELHQQEPEAFGLLLLNLARGMARTIVRMADKVAELDKKFFISGNKQ
ncbi:cyclic nucleotide-binding domain-containing protein [Pseudomonas sp. NyZ480]|uniref:Crp/Fnr family transcriptional regulator n=1 Tax=Pseudomonas sp. NyZ480 TaxID=3035289 RepID=UPI0024099C0E|nr:cyclic nucleotide-binding domain-containing protein [Pseudomonas sp. NyZ480]WEZ86617.1 cyclic nucleotide-binding domain-containing protein [Pseudomonas sp. NyZ480]